MATGKPVYFNTEYESGWEERKSDLSVVGGSLTKIDTTTYQLMAECIRGISFEIEFDPIEAKELANGKVSASLKDQLDRALGACEKGDERCR